MKPTHGLKPFHDFTPNERRLKAVEAKLLSPLNGGDEFMKRFNDGIIPN